MSGGGAGVMGNGMLKGKTFVGEARAGSGDSSVLGCILLTAKSNNPSSTMIRNENMMVRTVASR